MVSISLHEEFCLGLETWVSMSLHVESVLAVNLHENMPNLELCRKEKNVFQFDIIDMISLFRFRRCLCMEVSRSCRGLA